LLTAVGLTTGGSTTVHIYTKTIHGTTQLVWGKMRAVPRLYEFIPWHLPYNWGKSTEKPQSGLINITGRMCIDREAKLFIILFKLQRLLIRL